MYVEELLFGHHAYAIDVLISKLLKKLTIDYGCNVIKRDKDFDLIHRLEKS
jgi:hypothetical protein